MGGLGCDNMTAVLVCLLQEDTPEAYIARCSRKPVESAAGDATSLDSETYVTPQPSPVEIEPNEVAVGIPNAFKNLYLFSSCGNVIKIHCHQKYSLYINLCFL